MIIRLHHETNGDYEILVEKFYPQSLTFWSGVAEPVPAYEMKARKVGDDLLQRVRLQEQSADDGSALDRHRARDRSCSKATATIRRRRRSGRRRRRTRGSTSRARGRRRQSSTSCVTRVPVATSRECHDRVQHDGQRATGDAEDVRRRLLRRPVRRSPSTASRSITTTRTTGTTKRCVRVRPQEALWSADGAICLDWRAVATRTTRRMTSTRSAVACCRRAASSGAALGVEGARDVCNASLSVRAASSLRSIADACCSAASTRTHRSRASPRSRPYWRSGASERPSSQLAARVDVEPNGVAWNRRSAAFESCDAPCIRRDRARDTQVLPACRRRLRWVAHARSIAAPAPSRSPSDSRSSASSTKHAAARAAIDGCCAVCSHTFVR